MSLIDAKFTVRVFHQTAAYAAIMFSNISTRSTVKLLFRIMSNVLILDKVACGGKRKLPKTCNPTYSHVKTVSKYTINNTLKNRVENKKK